MGILKNTIKINFKKKYKFFFKFLLGRYYRNLFIINYVLSYEEYI